MRCFEAHVFWGDVQGPGPSATSSDPCSPTEGLVISFDVQMNQASAVRSPVDLWTPPL